MSICEVVTALEASRPCVLHQHIQAAYDTCRSPFSLRAANIVSVNFAAAAYMLVCRCRRDRRSGENVRPGQKPHSTVAALGCCWWVSPVRLEVAIYPKALLLPKLASRAITRRFKSSVIGASRVIASTCQLNPSRPVCCCIWFTLSWVLPQYNLNRGLSTRLAQGKPLGSSSKG